MKKKISILSVILLTISVSTFLFFSSFSKVNKVTTSNKDTYSSKVITNNKVSSSAKVSYKAESLDKFISDSQLIIEAIPTETQTEIVYSGVTFVTTQLKVKQVLKGDLVANNNTITLLQTKIDEDPIVEKGGHKLLFLEKYSGPIIKDAYVCKGLYQGQYDIDKDDTLVGSIDLKNMNDKLNLDITKVKTFKGLCDKIKSKS